MGNVVNKPGSLALFEKLGWFAIVFLSFVGVAGSSAHLLDGTLRIGDLHGYRETSEKLYGVAFTPHWYDFRHSPLVRGAHMAPGLIWMVVAPLQFVARIRQNAPRLHRWLGRTALAMSVILIPSGIIFAALHPFADAFEELAPICFFTVIYLVSVVLGVKHARQGNYLSHREWMIRAFSIGLGISSVRLWFVLFLHTTHVQAERFFATAFWVAFGLNLLIAEIWIYRTRGLVKVPARRPIAISEPALLQGPALDWVSQEGAAMKIDAAEYASGQSAPRALSVRAAEQPQRWARVQALSGLVFLLFAALHLVNTMLAGLGSGAYEAFQVQARRVYQWPLIEGALFAALALHVVSGVQRARQRARAAALLPEASRQPATRTERVHRFAGWGLALAIVGHVACTRGPSLFAGVYPGFAGIEYTITQLPWVSYPYFALLSAFGCLHAGLGGVKALAVFSSTPARRGRVFLGAWLISGLAIALAWLGILGLGGRLYPTADPARSEFAALIQRALAQKNAH